MQRLTDMLLEQIEKKVPAHLSKNSNDEEAIKLDKDLVKPTVDEVSKMGDLNFVDETTLLKAKKSMDIVFEQNRQKIGDQNFVYDVVRDFDLNDGNGDWDSDDETD